MKKFYFIVLVIMLLSSCTYVIRKDLMDVAIVDVPFSEIGANPDLYRGKIFILGGIIVNTKIIEKGSLIEAVYVPVDSRGYLDDVRHSNGRFLAFYPKEKGLLDPQIYHSGKRITVAGEFIETRTGKIDKMEYTYPFFEIKDIYLWGEGGLYYMRPPYPSWYYSYPYWWHEPWWR
jgi:outer membrane lipoprotein